ncbi:glycogen synthase [Foetidibacter luteolus]|uniref:glycogen synthase n=1 Tax=Foetidibacter luteolus TaxID=2608880 RepID=UPI00129B3656|nr:glycogen synthase [Foetidibacter luteolus]
MEIIHVSAECYPVAKAGGLGDVVGALPKYQTKMGHNAKVIMPMYKTKFLYKHEWLVDFKGRANLGSWWFDFTIIKEKHNLLGFDLYLVDINGLLDREKIYGYDDDPQRFTAFQICVLTWLSHWQHKPDVVHCHDHHTGLIPFMMKYCYPFSMLASVPSVITIHNAQYQGWMGWDKSYFIPAWDSWKAGMLEWKGTINPLASGIKCAWKVTTVSWSYLQELRVNSNGLEALFEYEKGKCVGILNGIDDDVWDPATDTYLNHNYSVETVTEGKEANKKILCDRFNLDADKPLIIFIGRLVGEKAADVLPDAIMSSMYAFPKQVNFLILGSGETHVEWQLSQLTHSFAGNYNVMIGYDEKLSHTMYAGADFLLMPSRVEPCGLNQMYSMKYGTVPMVRSTGGLIDTVKDMGEWQGWGIRFNHASVGDITHSVWRAIEVYKDGTHFNWMRQHMMQIDNSWENSVQQYLNIYQSLQ